MKKTIEAFIPLTDYEYMDNFSMGFHSKTGSIDVNSIKIGYPIADWLNNETKIFPIENRKYTIGELMRKISEIVANEIEKGNNFAPHVVDDYCIEKITIVDGIALVDIGS